MFNRERHPRPMPSGVLTQLGGTDPSEYLAGSHFISRGQRDCQRTYVMTVHVIVEVQAVVAFVEHSRPRGLESRVEVRG